LSSLVIVFISVILFFCAYRFYARKFEFLWQIDPKRSTPAFSKYDSVDYIPAKNWLILLAGFMCGEVMQVIFVRRRKYA
jgi:carbon starvation protein CstA